MGLDKLGLSCARQPHLTMCDSWQMLDGVGKAEFLDKAITHQNRKREV